MNTEISLSELKNQLIEDNLSHDQKELKLGEDKTVQIKKWTGKQILEYGKNSNDIETRFLSSDIDNVDTLLTSIPLSIEEFLLKPSVTDYDNYYFNDSEKLYLLFNLRKLSIPNIDLSSNQVCNKCQHQYKTITPISDIQEKIQLSKNGVISLANGVDLQIGSMKNPKAMFTKNKETKLLNELCLRVSSVSYNGKTSTVIVFEELLDIILSFNSTDLNELVSKYASEFTFVYSLEQVKDTCPSCSSTNSVDYEDIILLTQGI